MNCFSKREGLWPVPLFKRNGGIDRDLHKAKQDSNNKLVAHNKLEKLRFSESFGTS